MKATKISAVIEDLEAQAKKARELASRETDPSVIAALLETDKRRKDDIEMFGEMLRERLASAAEEGRHHALVALDQVSAYGSAADSIASHEQNVIDTFSRDPLALDYALRAYRKYAAVADLAEEIALVDGPALRRVERRDAPRVARTLDLGCLSYRAASRWYDLPQESRCHAVWLAWDAANA